MHTQSFAKNLIKAFRCALMFFPVMLISNVADAMPPSDKILVFTKTAGFRHDSIPAALQAVQALGQQNNFTVDATEDAAAFTDANLAQYKAVLFLLTSGDVLNSTQQAAFERYIRSGRGFVGVHSATDTEYSWAWYGGLVGAYFQSHPQIQSATIRVTNRSQPSTASLPANWTRTDEWYNFQPNPRTNNVIVLATLDESTYSGGTMGADHPIAWYHVYDGGRAWYTGGGHTAQSYSEPLFRQHLLGGILYAMGRIRPIFDYDGDGRTDVSVFRPSNGDWYVNRSANNSFSGVRFGQQGDRLAPADYDGDGKTDVCVFRGGNWYRLNSSDNQFIAVPFGTSGDVPVPGDFDGDGRADIAVFRPAVGAWYWLASSNNQFNAVTFGLSGDKPQIGDFDGDGKTDITVWRPSNGNWYGLRSSNNSFFGAAFGQTGDIPVTADYDGDGKADVAVFRPSNGFWYGLNSANNGFFSIRFGANGDVPVIGDYDGDGRADAAVFRSSIGSWFVQRTTTGFFGAQFGANNDLPTQSAFGQ